VTTGLEDTGCSQDEDKHFKDCYYCEQGIFLFNIRRDKGNKPNDGEGSKQDDTDKV